MAITVDQFLRDLTERRLLTSEQASTVRSELTTPTSTESEPPANPPVADELASQLVLCNSVIHEKVRDHRNHQVFQARCLRDDSPVTIHVLIPENPGLPRAAMAGINGKTVGEPAGSPCGVVDVVWHWDLLCVCCQPLEAETLQQLVLQNGALPLDLSTELLLQSVRCLQDLHRQGLHLCRVAPEWLLLDEAGQVHLNGAFADQLLIPASCQCSDPVLPNPSLLESLSQIYLFLQGEQSVWEESPLFTLVRSSRTLLSRLSNSDPNLLYRSWEDLVADLERMQAGEEIALPSSAGKSPNVSAEQSPAIPQPATKTTPQSNVKPSSAKGRSLVPWWILAMVLAAGITIAVVSMLGK